MISYAITDPSTLNFQTLTSDIKRFAKKADMIVYRDKYNSTYVENSKLFLTEARKYSFSKVLLHADYALASKLNADGIHLKSTQFSEIKQAKALGLFVVISTHTIEEAEEAEQKGADMITFSPIFSSPNKGEPKGLAELKYLVSKLTIPVIALGGILTSSQIELCNKNKAEGFASIRYFK